MSRRRPPDYDVGYGKPPKHGQVKKGEVRNPNGRRGAKAAQATDTSVLDMKMSVTIGGRSQRVPVPQAILLQYFQAALKGDYRAGREVLRADRERRAAGRGKVEPSPPPARIAPPIIFKRYGDDLMEALGVFITIDRSRRLRTPFVRFALAALTPNQLAALDPAELAQWVEDPSVIEEFFLSSAGEPLQVLSQEMSFRLEP